MRLRPIFRNLLITAASLSLTAGTATSAQAAPAVRYVTKTVTVKYTAQDVLNYWSNYDLQARNTCARAPRGVWTCKTHDAKKNPIGGYSTCMQSEGISVPEKVLAAAQKSGQQTISIKASLVTSKLSGGIYWKGSPALPHATATKSGTSGFSWSPFYAQQSWNLDLCLKPHTTASIKSFTVSYRYKVKA